MVSKRWVKKLLEEVNAWSTDGIINPDQKEAILSRYKDRLEYRRIINTISTLGSILIGLGILLFIASNWDKLGRLSKVVIIFGVILLFNYLGYFFRYLKQGYRGLAEGFSLIGAFAFGAGIWLIAQIYQIHYNFSAGIIFWILGILPLVYIYRSWSILALCSILSLIWLNSYSIYYFERDALGVFPLLIILISASYWLRHRFSLFMSVVIMSQWLMHFWMLRYAYILNNADNFLSAHISLVEIFILFGFILYGIGMWHILKKDFPVFSFLYKFLGIIFICIASYSLTFAHHYPSLKGGYFPNSINLLFSAMIMLLSLLYIGIFHFSTNKSTLSEARLMLYLIIVTMFVMMGSIILPASVSINFNIFLLVASFWFMYLGFASRTEGIFRLAIVIFFIDILSRYFDIFWKMLPRSLLFIFGGVILIAGAIFADKKRRQVEEQMRLDQVQQA